MLPLTLRRLFCVIALAGLPLLAGAATLVTGQISWVSDGDTVWLRPDAGQNLGKVRLDKGRVKLRLDAIDAPEICQDWGKEATAALKAQIDQQPVRAQLLHRDQYNRWLARLYLPQAQNLDVNAWLVAQGHAWDYQFASGKPGRYAPLQAEAVARAAERIWPQVTQALNWQVRGRTEIVVYNEFDVANGFTTPLPFNMIGVFLAPPDEGELLDNSTWLNLLLVHEFTHAVHLDKVRGVPRVLVGLGLGDLAGFQHTTQHHVAACKGTFR